MGDFLDRIRMIESSGGKDLNHKTINNGLQKGTRAVGEYGIMPNTALETLNRMRLNAQLPEQYRDYLGMSPDEITEKLESDKDLYQDIAKYNANRALERTDNNEDKAAYMWNQGLNLDPQDIDDDKLDKAAYVQRFRKLKDKLNGGENGGI